MSAPQRVHYAGTEVGQVFDLLRAGRRPALRCAKR